ncbi:MULTISPECIES: glycine zipper 2TM domain-containing protein [Amphritea]|jgi:outer membrane lipoprotein SlyB|uniref:Outer membrane lipoprotein SlyB n=2 Tax=Amphritea TaxID=515417 RepID=A0A1H9GV89_9GAMM|nr:MULTISPECIES: glycine zipper 2TM domain-containing protein [Amphritea]MBN0988975.1 glycine zipper 2TM domain-containing protein [Amphritea pacifica]MBN1005033.1 glycine zipper 2TM domain-containing protein [Amphritea pacifica]SEQ54022.1 outer membrane lipoprotein SlyB [Amphritea atlantica]
MNKVIMITFAAVVLLLQGCASSLSGDTYSRSEARKVQNVEYAWVDAVKPVVIEGRTDSPLGAGAGAIVGGIAGSTVGGGKGSSIASVVGAVAGGIVGQKIEENSTRKQGQEVTVTLESGRTISVVQEVDSDGFFQPGERVRVLRQGSTARIVR